MGLCSALGPKICPTVLSTRRMTTQPNTTPPDKSASRTQKSQTWIVGSDPICDVVIDDLVVSSIHCRLTRTASGYFLQDLHSTNGTYVRGVAITDKTPVQPSAPITLGTSQPLVWPQSPPTTGTRVVLIGRNPDNDVTLDHPSVSSEHARLLVTKLGIFLEDLGSTNGTFVGSVQNQIRKAQVTPDDVVYFGNYSCAVRDLISLRNRVAKSVPVGSSPGDVIIGRDPSCGQVVNLPLVSRTHARLSRSKSGYVLEDLETVNGTYVNGQRLDKPQVLNPGDLVQIGGVSFVFEKGKLVETSAVHGLTIEAHNLVVEVPGKRLLENISLVIKPGEFVGLMGPSGAGKTTLMNVLNGYSPPTEGQVLINGYDLYAHYSQFRGLLGYVPQDDIIHRDLTVREALYYTAKLRLPLDFSDADIQERIDTVLDKLDLQSTKDVLVGSPENKGISGGQRKRVNLAMEMLTDPPVLFLDEPTSGLSSEDALNVMRLLRSLADAGKVILLTIHQPSLEAYRQMDSLVLLSRDSNSPDPAQLAYYGPAYPDAVYFFNPEFEQDCTVERSPDDVLRGLAKGTTKQWAHKYDQSQYKRTYITSRLGRSQPEQNEQFAQPTTFADWTMQWWTLVRRSLKIKIKDRWNTIILLAQAPIVAVLLVLVFGNEVGQSINDENWHSSSRAISMTIFMLGLSSLWFGCSNAAREIVGEWAIYHRERMVNLQLPTYIFSKFTVLGALCVIQCTILAFTVVIGSGLKASAVSLLGTLWLVSTVGLAIGLLISSMARSSEVAIALLPIILIPMVILGGVMQPLHKMNGVMSACAFLAPSRWAFESMIVVESARQPLGPSPYRSCDDDDTETEEEVGEQGRPDMAENYFPEPDRFGVMNCKIVLLMMTLLLVFSIYITLRLRDVHQ